MSSSVKTVVRTYQNYINGQWVKSASGEMFPVYDPSTEAVIAQVASGGAADIDQAVKAARAAFFTSWRKKLARMPRRSPNWNAATPANRSSKRNTTSLMLLLVSTTMPA